MTRVRAGHKSFVSTAWSDDCTTFDTTYGSFSNTNTIFILVESAKTKTADLLEFAIKHVVVLVEIKERGAYHSHDQPPSTTIANVCI